MPGVRTYTLTCSIFPHQVRQKLLDRKQGMEKSEKAKKQRQLKKIGKKVCFLTNVLCCSIKCAPKNHYPQASHIGGFKVASLSYIADSEDDHACLVIAPSIAGLTMNDVSSRYNKKFYKNDNKKRKRCFKQLTESKKVFL